MSRCALYENEVGVEFRTHHRGVAAGCNDAFCNSTPEGGPQAGGSLTHARAHFADQHAGC